LGKIERRCAEQSQAMNDFMDFWPVLSGLIAVGALAIAFKAEISVRVSVLEEKIKTLFELINKMNK